MEFVKNKSLLVLHLIFIVSLAVIQIIYPILVSDLFDSDAVNAYVIMICALIAGKLIISTADTFLQSSLYWKSFTAMRRELVNKIVRMDYGEVLKHDIGELTQTVENDSRQVVYFYLVFLMTLIKDVLFLIGVAVVGFTADYKIGLLLTVIIVILFFAFNKINQKAESKWANTKTAYEKLYSSASQVFLMMKEMKYINKENFLQKRFFQAVNKAFSADTVSNFVSYQLWITTIFSFNFIKFSLLVLGAVHTVPVTTVFLFVYYLDLLNDPIEELRVQMENIPSFRKAKERVDAVIDIKSSLTFGKMELSEKITDVDLENVTFRYEKENVLQDVSIHFQRGVSYALMRPSGSGKSTLVNLLMHLYEPQTGEVKVNGININTLKEGELSRDIEYIGQNEDYDDTSDLSRGQTMYRHLKRGIDSNKSVVILDEIFTNIDSDKVLNAFDELKKENKIVIAVTHEKEIAGQCDKVIEMEALKNGAND